MNKLLLVGNGFDLAHGLPTSYKDFIDDIWKNLANNYSEPEYKKVFVLSGNLVKFLLEQNISNFNDFDILMNRLVHTRGISYNNDTLFSENTFRREVLLKVNNDFFILINSKNSIENWVDIENEYYIQLKEIVKDRKLIEKDKKVKVIKLNNEFEELKNLFEKFLLNRVAKDFDFNKIEDINDWLKINEILKPIIISKEPYVKDKILNLSKEFSFHKDEEEIQNYGEKISLRTVFEPLIFKSLILSFNYTPTAFNYNHSINNNHGFGKDIISCNYIHGELNSIKNKINFGFGDEIDNSYKEIEDIGDNEYLKNFKSFQYSNTQNYDDLLRYIDSDKFQICILGHSCGLSDRVLLNTIFEHENCRSIKVYYHEKEKGLDNYTDIIQNISRHFNDKASMRRKIVNKELCSPLPQNVRFKKIEKKD